MRVSSILYFIIILFFAGSCKYFGNIGDNEKVAELNGEAIYASDIKAIIPPGTALQDSISMVNQYVNSWAINNLLALKAEKQLSKEDKDVRDEIEEYRRQLLVFRYEKQYVEERLDTTVVEDEMKAYYDNNSKNFTQSTSIVKARLIKISSVSPNIELVRKIYKSQYTEDLDELERLTYNSADRFNNFNDNWVEMNIVARELPLDIESCEKDAWSKSCIETKDSLYNYFVYFSEKIAPNQIAPYEYYKPKIKEIILSKRKQSLLDNLKINLIKEAIENKDLKTNIKIN